MSPRAKRLASGTPVSSARRTSRAPFDAGNESFRAELREFVASEVTPRVEAWERRAQFPSAALRACGRRGYLGLNDSRTAILAEELSRCGSLGVALSVFVQAGLIRPLVERHGSRAQRTTLLAKLRAGRLVGALAVTEPGAGSDLAALRSCASKRGRDLLVDAEKTYITSAAAADFLIVAAKIEDDADFSLMVVPARTDGLKVTRLRTLGLASTAMGRVVLRRCRVPATSLLGGRGAGYALVQEALDRERLYGGIGAVAWAELALGRTIAYLRDRRAFGRPVSRFQAVRHQLADCAAALEAARQLAYAAYEGWASGARATRDIAMVKLFTYAQAQRTVELCLQLHGGLGYMEQHWTARCYRDARALTIAAGTPEVMRDLIAAHLRL